MQAMSRHMEAGFSDAVQTVVQQATTYFLQDLTPAPQPGTSEEPGTSDPCQEDRHDHDPAPASSSPLVIRAQSTSHVPGMDVDTLQGEDVFAYDERKLRSDWSSESCSAAMAVPPAVTPFAEAVTPFWLTFKDPVLEKTFCLSQAVSYITVTKLPKQLWF